MRGGLLTSSLGQLATAAMKPFNGFSAMGSVAHSFLKPEGNVGTPPRSIDAREATVTHLPFKYKTDGPRYAKPHPFFDKILPKLEGPRPELKFANRRTLVRGALELAFGSEHKFYGALGLAANMYSISLALTHYGMHVGMREFVSQYIKHATTDAHIPVEENDFIWIARRHYLHGIHTYARALNLDVTFEMTSVAAKKYPTEGTAFLMADGHASIFGDFLNGWFDPATVPVGAEENLGNDRVARWLGVRLFFDLMGIPETRRASAKEANGDERKRASINNEMKKRHVEWWSGARLYFYLMGIPETRRASAKETNGDESKRASINKEMKKRLDDLVIMHETRPILFGQGGRVPTAYEDNGEQAMAGFYSNVPKPKKPRTYFLNREIIHAARTHAKKTGKEVSLPLMSLRGTEWIMPKHAAKKFPFLGVTRIGKKITYRVIDVLTVRPNDKQVHVHALAEQAVNLLKDDRKINLLLENDVDRWGSVRGKEGMGEKFMRAAAADEGYFIAADRIRLYDESHAFIRNAFIKKLIDCVEVYTLTGVVPTARVKKLIDDVS